MYVVIVTPNKDGKIEFTKEELQKMLDEAYNKGYAQGKAANWDTITVPSWPHNWYSTNATQSELTINASSATGTKVET